MYTTLSSVFIILNCGDNTTLFYSRTSTLFITSLTHVHSITPTPTNHYNTDQLSIYIVILAQSLSAQSPSPTPTS